MRIVVVLGLDGSNFFLENVLKVLVNKGHSLSVYARSLENVNTRMFQDIVGSIGTLELLDENISNGEVDEYDCALCANDATQHLLDAKIYIFTYSITSIFGTYLAEGGDLMFLTSKPCYERGFHEDCTIVPVGNPKFDAICKYENVNHKQFLFIDSGHYPFGEKGKKVIAETLVQVAKAYPDYKLVIKPRFLKNDDNVTHKNTNHLYSNIEDLCAGNIPSNLIMPNEYGDMNKMICESETVICLYTSAYQDVAVQGKGLLILDGIPSNESCELRKDFHWKIMRNECEKTGCLIDYKDILKHLPYGEKCNADYLSDKLPIIGNSSDIIVNVMEEIVAQIKCHKMPQNVVVNYCESNQLSYDKLDWNELIRRRKKNYLLYWFTRRIDCANININIDRFLSWLVEIAGESNFVKYDIGTLLKYAEEHLQETILENSDLLMDNAISESFYMEQLYKHNPAELLRRYNDKLESNRSRNFYLGMAKINNGCSEEGVKALISYLKECSLTEYYEYTADKYYRQIFPLHRVNKGDRVMICGADNFGKSMGELLISSGYASLICYIDDKEKGEILGKRIIPSLFVNGEDEYDVIVISSQNRQKNIDGFNTLLAQGVPKTKIISYFIGD